MYYFGYVDNPSDSENKTPFFKYDHQEADLDNYYSYKLHNAKMIE